jgi:hypothetical protein
MESLRYSTFFLTKKYQTCLPAGRNSRLPGFTGNTTDLILPRDETGN